MVPSDYTFTRAADEEPNGQAKVGSAFLFSLLPREILMNRSGQKAGEGQEDMGETAVWGASPSGSDASAADRGLRATRLSPSGCALRGPSGDVRVLSPRREPAARGCRTRATGSAIDRQS